LTGESAGNPWTPEHARQMAVFLVKSSGLQATLLEE
jgi:hypothetical protein